VNNKPDLKCGIFGQFCKPNKVPFVATLHLPHDNHFRPGRHFNQGPQFSHQFTPRTFGPRQPSFAMRQPSFVRMASMGQPRFGRGGGGGFGGGHFGGGHHGRH
jgi:UDP:flavonoid glycosyltransferase YjiC (YdhE family)